MNVTLAWKMAKILGPWIIGAIIGGIIVGKVQQVRLDTRAVELTRLQHELTVCQESNVAGQATIESLRDELRGALKNCESRIRAKEKTLSEIRMIDSVTIKRGTNEDNGDSDPLLGLLNGVYDAPGGQADHKD